MAETPPKYADWNTLKSRLATLKRLRSLPKLAHIFAPLRNPNRLPK